MTYTLSNLTELKRLRRSRVHLYLHAVTAIFLAAYPLTSLAEAPNDIQMEYTTDLTKILNGRGYSVADVVTVAASLIDVKGNTSDSKTSHKINWNGGYTYLDGSPVAGGFSILPDRRDINFAPDRSLRITAGISGLAGIGVDSCAGGKCTPIPVEAIGAQRYRVKSEDMSYTIIVYSDLCSTFSNTIVSSTIKSSTEQRCSVLIQSWNLAQLVARGDGSMSDFPRQVTFLQLPDRLVMIDPTADPNATSPNHHYFSMDLKLPKKDPLTALGKLASAAYSNRGQLILKFDGGTLLVDLAQDLVIASTSSGELYLKDTGIGRGEMLGFSPISASNSDSVLTHHANLLAMSGDWLITSKGATQFSCDLATGCKFGKQLTESDGTWTQAHKSISDPLKAHLLADKPNGLAVVDLDLALMSLSHNDTTSFSNSLKGSDLYLLADVVMVSEPQAWVIPRSMGAESTVAIPGARQREQIVAATGSVLAERPGTAPGKCQWTRHRLKNAKDSGYYEDGILSADCSAHAHINQANEFGAEAISIWNSSGNLRTVIFNPP